MIFKKEQQRQYVKYHEAFPDGASNFNELQFGVSEKEISKKERKVGTRQRQGTADN